jgi:hypothetical protein
MGNIFNVFVVGALMVLTLSAVPPSAAQDKPTYVLLSRRGPDQIDRVEVTLEVGGDVLEVVQKKVHREKMSVVCKLDYDEKTLELPVGSPYQARSIRYYDMAEATVKVGRQGLKPVLRAQRRLIGASIDVPRAVLFSPRGTLSRDELELIDVQGNSLLLDQFLPEGPVAVGDKWKHSGDLIAALLGLDEVGQTDVQSTLSEVTDAAALMEISGRIDGAIYGVSTDIELLGRYRFDRRIKRIDWFTMLVKEQRNSSPVADGVDVTALLEVNVLPKASSPQLAEGVLEGLSLEPSTQLKQLSCKSAEGGWRLTHDRCWHVYRDQADLVVLRMMDRGKLVAQCNVSPLPKVAPGKQNTLSKFQEDVRSALGETFGEFVEAGQSSNEANYRVYRVVVRGKVSELPIQWNYYLVADEQGQQAVFAFSVESELVEQLGKADQGLVDSLRFLEPVMAGTDGK